MLKGKRLNKKTGAVILVVIIIASIVFAYSANVIITWMVGNFEPSIVLEQPPDDTGLYVNTTTFEWNSSDENPEDVLTNIWYADVVDTFSSPMLRQVNVGENESYDPNPFEDGEWFWRVSVFDGTESNVSVTWNFTIKVNDTNSFPVLSGGQVSPTSGNTATSFIYNVTLYDNDNTTPVFIYVNIDGTNYSMTEVDPGDTNISDGKNYQYTTSLSEGNDHNYSFIVFDGYAISATAIIDNPDVAYVGMSPPTQSNPYPENESINIDIPLGYFEITINDADGHSMNISLRTNYSGSWVTFNSSIGLGNNTYRFYNTTWLTGFSDQVYWSVNLTDGIYWNNKTYWFITEGLDVICIYPTNGSMVNPQPYLTFGLVNPSGTNMSYWVYVGNSSENTTTLLSNDTSVGNGTYYHLFADAVDLNSTYYWRVYVTDDSLHLNETFNFGITIGQGGFLPFNNGFLLVIGLSGWIFGILAMMIALYVYVTRKKKKSRVVRGYKTSGRVKGY